MINLLDKKKIGHSYQIAIENVFRNPGTDKAIQIPEALELEESHVTMASPSTNQTSSVRSHVTAVPNALEPPEGEITLDSKQQKDTAAVEKSEASLDFYS